MPAVAWYWSGSGQPDGGYDASQAFSGEMRDVRIWSDVRSETEIRDEMNNTDLDTAADALVSYYKLAGDTLDSGPGGQSPDLKRW